MAAILQDLDKPNSNRFYNAGIGRGESIDPSIELNPATRRAELRVSRDSAMPRFYRRCAPLWGWAHRPT